MVLPLTHPIMPKRSKSKAQILLFDGNKDSRPASRENEPRGLAGASQRRNSREVPSQGLSSHNDVKGHACRAVLCGTYRRDKAGLRLVFSELQDLGCELLSPMSAEYSREDSGFVYMVGEETSAPHEIELRHLEAIQRADFVWLHAPDGYVGLSASLEVGFAKACSIPVFAREQPEDKILASFVTVVRSPEEVISQVDGFKLPPPQPAVQSFQSYYKRIAQARGYEGESARDCVLLMVEEVGELARAIRKSAGLKRDSSSSSSDEALEIADVFIYITHLANVLEIDLSKAVQQKELINMNRFLHRDD